MLDRAPPGPAVHAGQAEESGPGDLAGARPAVIGRDQFGKGARLQICLRPDVAELEAGVVVAGELVVDQPDPFSVVDEVGGQQVVVAGDGAVTAARGQRPAGLIEVRQQVVVARRYAETTGADRFPVSLLDGEHVEVVAEPVSVVQAAARLGDAGYVAWLSYVRAGQGLALDVCDDQHAVLRAVLDNRRGGAGGRGGDRVPVLDVPVDGEQVAAGARDPGDEAALRSGHLVDAVGQAAGQLADRTRLAGQARGPVEEGVDIRADHLPCR